VLKRHITRALGWSPVAVPFGRWAACGTDRTAKARLLLELLDRGAATVLA
jgi:hypothetical protein